ncbi:unnamed protein product [Durusdinium trenchii]|uniref:Uncharacterized protein n=1 Tax=Durusdinium trenchii TaxID=1381693 RepID=A0ABP0HW86_9DINO
MPVKQLRKELAALSWMREELEERRRQAEELRRENAELKAAREEFQTRYGQLLQSRRPETAKPEKEGRCPWRRRTVTEEPVSLWVHKEFGPPCWKADDLTYLPRNLVAWYIRILFRPLNFGERCLSCRPRRLLRR